MIMEIHRRIRAAVAALAGKIAAARETAGVGGRVRRGEGRKGPQRVQLLRAAPCGDKLLHKRGKGGGRGGGRRPIGSSSGCPIIAAAAHKHWGAVGLGQRVGEGASGRIPIGRVRVQQRPRVGVRRQSGAAAGGEVAAGADNKRGGRRSRRGRGLATAGGQRRRE